MGAAASSQQKLQEQMYNPQKCMHARQSLEVIRHSLDQLHKRSPIVEHIPPTNAVAETVPAGEDDSLRKNNLSNGSRKRARSLYGAGHHPSFLTGNHVDLDAVHDIQESEYTHRSEFISHIMEIQKIASRYSFSGPDKEKRSTHRLRSLSFGHRPSQSRRSSSFALPHTDECVVLEHPDVIINDEETTGEGSNS